MGKGFARNGGYGYDEINARQWRSENKRLMWHGRTDPVNEKAYLALVDVARPAARGFELLLAMDPAVKQLCER